MKTCFIHNPHSGRRDDRLKESLATLLRQSEQAGDRVRHTQGPLHATQLAKEALADGYELIVAVGGDGTVNEVAATLIGSQAALGIVPCGSGNGLARHLGIPLSAQEAFALCLAEQKRIVRIDTGLCDGRPFFNVMGLGLDAEVSARFEGLSKRGLISYVRSAFESLREHKAQSYTICNAMGERHQARASLVAVANSSQYGNNAFIAPQARIDDGQLDLILIEPLGLWGALQLGRLLFNGRLMETKRVKSFRSTRFSIERQGAGPMHLDGQPLQGSRQVQVEIRSQSLSVLVALPRA
jgi:diacylglycerol kinase (ATP)